VTRSVRIGLIALGVVVVVGFGLLRTIGVSSFRPMLESELSAALGRTVKVGDLSLSLWAGEVRADDISIADDPAVSKDAFVTARSLSASVKLRDLILSKTLHVTAVTLEKPQIRLNRGTGGLWNFLSLGRASGKAKRSEDGAGAPSMGTILVDKLTIEKGRVVVGTANSQEKSAAYENVNIELIDPLLPFEFSAGLPSSSDSNPKGHRGPINAGNMGAAPLKASLQIRKVDFAAPRVVSPVTGIAALTNIDGHITSVDQQVKTSGASTAGKLKLAAKGTPSALKSISRRSSDWSVLREHFAQTLLTRDEMGMKFAIDSGNEELSSLFLLRRYLQDTKWVSSWKSTEEMKNFQTYITYFKKYAAQYNFDYLMLIAQAYQESRLDQSRTSPVGAVGIMQVIPEFAAAPPINIPDVLTPEANIHAGTKMLHFDQTYFRNQGIDQMNKTLLSFASYNAGPTRIARLRKQAKREGLDPNQWFDNVEMVVAREVGQETVQYVSNIYKHYIAYKLGLEHGYGSLHPSLAIAR
jgi:soluble lytic murein transglycosylase-like protein